MKGEELKSYYKFLFAGPNIDFIVELTFRRYIELQKSEANAKETVKQAVLDRVRAEIASMRTPNDLETITPLIWNELTVFGILRY